MEIFKDIKGHEGQFQISNKGTVKRLPYQSRNRHGAFLLPELIKKPCLNGNGYLIVSIKGKGNLIHRLIATAFIPNPENKPCINHIDGNKLNNNITNLEWCTYADNNLHAYKNGLKQGAWKNKHGEMHHSSKAVAQIDMNGVKIAE